MATAMPTPARMFWFSVKDGIGSLEKDGVAVFRVRRGERRARATLKTMSGSDKKGSNQDDRGSLGGGQPSRPTSQPTSTKIKIYTTTTALLVDLLLLTPHHPERGINLLLTSCSRI